MKNSVLRLTLLLLISTLFGTSCRTFRGFGQDVQRAGNQIEHAANH